jgi:ABC-type transport system substrate-binding protein
MSKNLRLLLMALLLGVLLAACTPAATPTEAPTEEAPTEEAPTDAAPTETEAAYEGLVVSAECADGGSKIKEIAAIDALTVKFTMCVPVPAFKQQIALPSFGIQPREYLEQTGGTGDLLEKPIGTGPYMIDTWARGESITFTRFDDYWGDPAVTSTLIFRWNSEGPARLLELQSGNIDGMDNPSPDDYETISGDDTLQLVPRDPLNVLYIGMTDTFEPWSDVKVRQAIAMGIDRQRIVDTYYPVGSSVASHFTPCSIENGCVGDAWYDFDPEAAKALLAEAGLGDGFSTKLYYRDVFRGYLPEPDRVAEDLQAQLKENLNIDVEIVEMESGQFIDDSTNGRLDGLYMLGWGADYPHVTNFLDFHFAEANPQFGTPHPEIFEKLAAAAQIADPAEAEPLYIEINNAIKELVPMIPIANGASAAAYRADVNPAFADPLTNERFYTSVAGDRDTFVWMQSAEPISLFCGDETDGESLRACEQVTEPLLNYELGGTAVVPALATDCVPNADGSEWTCTLREGVKFHDGSDLDANDVVATLSALWDASNPLHVGNTGAFEYFAYFFGLINVPQ